MCCTFLMLVYEFSSVLCAREKNIRDAFYDFNVFSSYNLVMTCYVTILFAQLSSAVDIISAIEFDKSGDHLATGDRGGRVVLFERTDIKDVRSFFFCKISHCMIYFSCLSIIVLCCNAFLCNVIFSMVGPGGIMSRWITQLSILSFDIKQNFRVMNQRYI